MREFMTVREAADKWNISERQVQILCKNNRIDGIERIGRNWIIPCNAKKPEDGRIKTGKYLNWRSPKTREEER